MAENQNAADQASTLNDERATRLAKRAALFEAGQNPYPEHSELEDYVADIEAKYAELADGEDTEDAMRLPRFSCSAASTTWTRPPGIRSSPSTWATSWA